MDQPLYDIYFTGKTVEGIDNATAKSNLAALFKLPAEQVSKYFDGKAHLLKRGTDKTGALKYKAALHKAGLMVAVKAHSNLNEQASNQQPTQRKNQQTESTTTNESQISSSEGDWSLAPPGSDVLKPNERKHVENLDIDTSNIKLVSAFMSVEPEPQPDIPPPDTKHISLAPPGEDLLESKSSPPPPTINTDDIDLAPVGSVLDEIKPEVTPLNPDTSALSIASPGVDLLEGQIKPEPPAPPNTDHIEVRQD